MKELAKDIFIEVKFSGVVVGAIRTAHGLILIDAPFKVEDVRSWCSFLSGIGGGQERILVNLDTHLDRTLGVKGMESVVIAHQKAVTMIKSRPNTSKGQEMEAGAMWESYDGLNSIRWVPPEITFEQQLYLDWGVHPVILEHHAGANAAGVWVNIPDLKVVFVGDSVLVDQPPFLAFSDVPLWLEDLKFLLSSKFSDYQIVGGRNGLITKDDVREMVKLISSLHHIFERLREKNVKIEEAMGTAPSIMKRYADQPDRQEIYLNRLRWGLSMYYEQHIKPHK